MNKPIQSSIIVPIIATVLMLMLTLLNAKGQSPKSNSFTSEKIIQKSFQNTNNEFFLYGVGKVILKNSNSNTIRCEVRITGYGSSAEEAQRYVESVEVEVPANMTNPKMYVNMRHGRYNERHCKVVTTVYLPPTTVLQHNEDMNMEEMLYRLIDKFRR